MFSERVRSQHPKRGPIILLYKAIKQSTTLFSLSDHYILSREWRVIVDQEQTNYHGGPMVL